MDVNNYTQAWIPWPQTRMSPYCSSGVVQVPRRLGSPIWLKTAKVTLWFNTMILWCNFPAGGSELVVLVHTGVSVIYNYCDGIKDKRLFYCHRMQFDGKKILKQIFFKILSLNGHLSNWSYWKHWAALELDSVSLYQGAELLYMNQQGDMDCLECSRHRVLIGILKHRNIPSSPEVKQQHECALKSSRFRQHFDLSLYSLWPLAFSFHGPDNISSHTSTSLLFYFIFFTNAPLYRLHPSPPLPV